MIDDPDLLDTLFGIGQMFSLLLLLFGVYLCTLKAAFTALRSDEYQQLDEPSRSRVDCHSPQERLK
jgi:hypothetical protein